MGPVVEELAEVYAEDVVFAKVDVDVLRDVAEQYKINSLPTFTIFEGSVISQTILGASKNALEDAIKEYTSRN